MSPDPLSVFDRYRELIDDWPAFLDALGRPLPPSIWANTLRVTAEEVAAQLAADGVEAVPLGWRGDAFRLPPAARPAKSLAFATGMLHVQEEVSQVPVTLLGLRPGESFLDLCAAPGGKTLQAAVAMGDRGTILANDRSHERAGVLRRHLERLGVTCAAVTIANAANLPGAMGRFDRVLADVPCSCEGTSRKNPKVLRLLARRPAGLNTGGQTAILRKAVQLCRPGGRIAYSTCTYAPEENERVVARVLAEAEPGSLRLAEASLPDLCSRPGLTGWREETWDPSLARALRVYPHHNDCGGFFVALLEKAP